MYCAIIADIVNSRALPPGERAQVQLKLTAVLQEINVKYAPGIAAGFLITLGDEFQGLLSVPSAGIDIVEDIRWQMLQNDIALRFGIGIGEIHTPIDPAQALGADGPAYHRAREALNLLKAQSTCTNGALNAYLFTPASDQMLISALLTNAREITSQWSDTQLLTLQAWRGAQGRQNQVAAELGKNPSTISRQLRSARVWLYADILNALKGYLQSVYDPREEAAHVTG